MKIFLQSFFALLVVCNVTYAATLEQKAQVSGQTGALGWTDAKIRDTVVVTVGLRQINW